MLAKIDIMVRLYAAEEGLPVGSRGPFAGNSLEELAKDGDTRIPTDKITYLPSGQRGPNATDGNLLRLRKNHPTMHARVVKGEITLRKAMAEIRGDSDINRDPVDRAMMYIKNVLIVSRSRSNATGIPVTGTSAILRRGQHGSDPCFQSIGMAILYLSNPP